MKKTFFFLVCLLMLLPLVFANPAWNQSLFNTANTQCTYVAATRNYAFAWDAVKTTSSWYQTGTTGGDYAGGCLIELSNSSPFNIQTLYVLWYSTDYNADGGEIYGSNDISKPSATTGTWAYLGAWSGNTASHNVTFTNDLAYKYYLINMTNVVSPANPGILDIQPYGNLTNQITVPPVNISFTGQTPLTLYDTTLFTTTLNTTYTYELTGLNIAYIGYYYNASSSGCVALVNNWCFKDSDESRVKLGNTSNSTITYSFGENDVYPFIANINYSGAPINIFNTTNTNAFFADSYGAPSTVTINENRQYNFYELQLNGTGLVSVYFYNESYDFNSNVLSNNNVVQICSINAATPNHTHSAGVYDHLCPFFINSSGYVGTVKVSENSGFLIRGNTNNLLFYGYNGTPRNNVTRTTFNNGNSWSTLNATLRSHLHQFGANDRFCYQALGNYSTGTNPQSDTVRCTTIALANVPPSPPIVKSPNSTQNHSRMINISYLASVPNTPFASISYYNLSVVDENDTFIGVITNNNGVFTNYSWNTYAQNLSTTTPYKVRVTAYENTTLTSTAQSELFFVTTNTLLNISVRNSTAQIVPNTTITITSINGNHTFFTNGTLTYEAVKGVTYNISANNSAYSIGSSLITPTTNNTIVNISVLTLNTFELTFYNESTNAIMNNQTVFVEIISPVYAANFTTNNSRFNLTMLTPSDYTIRYYVDARVPRDYYVTLNPQSYNNLSLYVLDYDVSQTYAPIVIDQNTVPVAGATIRLLRYYVAPNDYVVVEMAKTDTNGQAVLRVVPNVINYKLLISRDSFSITTQPQKFTSATNTYTMNTRQSPLTSYNALPGVLYNFSFIETTNTYVVSWLDASNIVTGGCLYVDKISEGKRTREYAGCTSGASGSTIYTITDTNGTRYESTAYLSTSTTYTNYPLGTITQDFVNSFRNFGLIGMLLTVFVVLAVAFIGGENGTRGLVVTGVVAILFMGVFGIIPYTQETIIGIIIIAGIIIYKLRGSA